MKTKTHFAFRVDIWDDTGDSIVEHVAGAGPLATLGPTLGEAKKAHEPKDQLPRRTGIAGT
jgi:hypothetical protein